MASSRVLSVGQCGFDSASLERFFEQDHSAEVDSVDSARDALSRVASEKYDLVLVNRRLDMDGSSGVALLEELQAQAPGVPVMLVSDKADAQAEAVAKGALPGFGKGALRSPETAEKIRVALKRSGGEERLP
ncbi:Response regulator receiver domain protein [Caulifigura coniformis]|uniref:Response regulator receiver domain protein n=1 Tax=Caulifigura coniformis TaxID=2527983 RepID=A0A517SD09_9PLAN|nr:response regulator [Caulifigura coniformis]QDT53997.1 Response regulator receiver domain protein [Caulifigura coniformis]